MDALDALAPTSERYAHVPMPDAFDWSVADGALGIGEWYLVVFRSIRRVGADEERLRRFDDDAHAEAAGQPGFVHYFKGPAALDQSCLSFCLWDSRSHARSAAGRPAHVSAVALLDEMYESYALEFLRVGRAALGARLTFEPYDAAPAHQMSLGEGDHRPAAFVPGLAPLLG